MKSVHFVGVSGIGVSAVARISIDSGLTVSGSADIENEQTESLKKAGLTFYLGHKAEQIEKPDLVVRSAAVPEQNPEILEAIQKKIPVCLYSEYLAMLMSKKKGIAVAGTHGKTSTTALLATILACAGFEPTVVCGGVMQNFSSNAVYGQGDYFVSEACEYNRSFLDLKKWAGIVTNIEPDHLDYYRDINDIKDAFSEFLKTADHEGFSVVNGDDKNVREILERLSGQRIYTVGLTESSRYRIVNIDSNRGIYSFQIEENGKKVMELHLTVPGGYNCMNAALSAVLALKIGVEGSTIERAMRSFKGTRRRMEYLGEVAGKHVYIDYAHHPTEIGLTLGALREMYPSKKIAVVFQPHQYSRTAVLFQDFVKELLRPDAVILMEIYRQRDSDTCIKAVKSIDLYKELRKAGKTNVACAREAEEIIKNLDRLIDKNFVIVFMGAGDVDDTARAYVRSIIKRSGRWILR